MNVLGELWDNTTQAITNISAEILKGTGEVLTVAGMKVNEVSKSMTGDRESTPDDTFRSKDQSVPEPAIYPSKEWVHAWVSDPNNRPELRDTSSEDARQASHVSSSQSVGSLKERRGKAEKSLHMKLVEKDRERREEQRAIHLGFITVKEKKTPQNPSLLSKHYQGAMEKEPFQEIQKLQKKLSEIKKEEQQLRKLSQKIPVVRNL